MRSHLIVNIADVEFGSVTLKFSDKLKSNPRKYLVNNFYAFSLSHARAYPILASPHTSSVHCNVSYFAQELVIIIIII